MTPQLNIPLPCSAEECRTRGWQQPDIILVSGDAYVDHPSFGLAVIGRLLEAHGYRVAVLAQPDCSTPSSFMKFGRPKLFFGISGGNLDSVVANYSGNGKVRDFDAYSPGGSPWRTELRSRTNRYRPDRAVLVYANLARQAFPGVPLVLGGVEASLRRFIHFDYQQQRLRGSHLTDAKGDLLIYGMGERAVLEAAETMAAGRPIDAISGSCIRVSDEALEQILETLDRSGRHYHILPSWQEIQQDSTLFLAAEKTIDRHARAGDRTVLLQHQQASWVIQHPPAAPLCTEELDQLYALPYSRLPHPQTPEIPAFTMVKDSITIVRGCCGNCSFCAITRHQGPHITSRSVESIVAEVQHLSHGETFNGTISDLGGPTANLYGARCAIGSCKRHDCLYPHLCKHLVVDETQFLDLLTKVGRIDGVNHVYISSGLRLELLLATPKLFEKIIMHHCPGTMKIAPEHTDDEVLRIMHKEPFIHLEEFVRRFRSLVRTHRKRIELIPYIISAHPGCDDTRTIRMIERLKKLNLPVRSFQDFTPTPGTLSTAMFVTGLDRDTGAPLIVVRNQAERLQQRRLIERAFIKCLQQKRKDTRNNRIEQKQHRKSSTKHK